MVRPITLARRGELARRDGPARPWKAALAVAVVAAGLLWHVLACTESPMAFSPNGKDLAFVTMEPYGGDDLLLTGAHTYRLMILSGLPAGQADTNPLRTLEETRDAMLTAPAWSPDGATVSYLQIPLFTQEQLDQTKAVAKKRSDLLKEAESLAPESPPPAADSNQSSSPPPDAPNPEDLTLPPFANAAQKAKTDLVYPPVPAALIVRSAADGQILSTTPLQLSLGEPEAFLMTYLLVRPQYSPDGKCIYLLAGNTLMAIHPAEQNVRRLAAPAAVFALAPDGETIATFQDSAVAFLKTDGSSALYRRWITEGVSLSGLAWLDAKTLALLHAAKSAPADKSDAAETTAILDLIRSDGTPLKPRTLRFPDFKADKDKAGELAIAPNGKWMAISFGKDVFFLKTGGEVLSHWHDDRLALVQPTFTPDSKRLAFKRMAGTDPDRAQAIVFFTPEGKELTSVDIPAAAPLPPPAPTAPPQPVPSAVEGPAPSAVEGKEP
jgi:hypothetical protein